MSLITRCPACTTMFKVVPDQLRVSDGWVRCGQCDEVFDANVHMQSGIQISEDPAPIRKAVWGVSLPEEPREARLPGVPEEVFDDAIEEEPIITPPPDTAESEFESALVDREVAFDSESVRALEPRQKEGPDAEATFADDELLAPLAESVSRQADVREINWEPDLPQLSFMQAPFVPSVWNKPLVRAGLATFCVFLGVFLLLQVLVQERDRIAATEPDAKAFLVSVCAVWGCEISPLRQIDSVVIDSSSFVKVRADVYRLNFTLKNTAKIGIATPSLELSLTDMKDQSAIRRVITVSDFAPQQALIGPQAELIASLPISVKLSGDTERISGYRLLAFYP
ncbi:MAG: zinc-ribbon and DUF3426 domain-containing protein [Rhodoferax sp.]|nr:zinc-ribbon and DUF3426 domain-containing protein [Rhodoferax sp.]MDP3651313.1 zinc-ribbon and DUF3426 domain-containing protein [Rhodoferax sp.]